MFSVIAILLVALFAYVSHWGVDLQWIWSYLIAVNLVTLMFYGYDKRRAIAGGGRVPEKVLHGLAFAGGTPGAFAGQTVFRHKTIKGSFRRVFRAIFILQVGLIVWWIYAARG